MIRDRIRHSALLVCIAFTLHGLSQANDGIDLVELEQRIARAHAHRLDLLKHASGEGTIRADRNTSDDTIAKLKSMLRDYKTRADEFRSAGDSTVLFSWSRNGEKVRFDTDIAVDTGFPDDSLFGASRTRAAGDFETLLFIDLANLSGGISRPPVIPYNPSGVLRWLDIEKVYSFGFEPVAEVLRILSKEDPGPTRISAYEDVFEGIPCITIELSARYGYTKTVWNTMSSVIRVAPQQSYSVLDRRFTSEWHSHLGPDLRTVREGSATYAESEKFPGVWLMETMFVHVYEKGDIRIKESVSIALDSFEVGTIVPEETFSFQGLGLPDRAAVVDRRFPGKSRGYRYSIDQNIGVDTPVLLDLRQTLPEIPNDGSDDDIASGAEPARELQTDRKHVQQGNSRLAVGGGVAAACAVLAMGWGIRRTRKDTGG